MSLQSPNINHLWTTLLVEELHRNGVEFFCIAPGSRSAPLASAVVSHPRVRQAIHFDERGVAYRALGYARATGKPAAVITTSGTAVANLLPAVVEAAMDHVPLIILSADRPPELRANGANQAIDQTKIFGSYARWYFELPCPEASIPAEMVLTTAAQAVYRAMEEAGPVHLNFMFREPLAPVATAQPAISERIQRYWAGNQPYTRYSLPVLRAPDADLDSVAARISSSRRGLLILGEMSRSEDIRAALALSRKLDWPTLPDITSQCRLSRESDSLIPHFDAALSARSLWDQYRPDTVLQLGGRFTSKRLLELLERHRPETWIQVTELVDRQDPNHQLTDKIRTKVAGFCEALGARPHIPNKGSEWLQQWQELSQSTQSSIEESMDRVDSTEPGIARAIARLIPEGHGLFLGSSMPIRDVDMFAAPRAEWIATASNRGASGIDGNIATACGWAEGLDRPVTALLGDLASLHDLNSLAMLSSSRTPVTVVIINNDGGGIFSFLPVAKFPRIFEPAFTAPHGIAFEKAAALFGLPYRAPKTQAEFEKAYVEAVESKRPSIVEVRTNRNENFELHQEIFRKIEARLSGGKHGNH